jgi:hypothetical protein
MPENVIRTAPRTMSRHDRQHQVDGRIDGPIELPLVIRPAPLRLFDVERRLRSDLRLLRALREHPELRATLSRAIWNRDPAARARFPDASSLGEHLATVLH